jgi:fucose permease
MLFHVYADPKPEGYYVNEPFGIYRTMLDADWPVVILLPLLAVIVVALLMLAWRIHEIPAHKADKKKSRQAELVSALTLLGLLEHWVWAVALFFAYVDWDAAENWLVNILRRARMPADEIEAKKDAAGKESQA